MVIALDDTSMRQYRELLYASESIAPCPGGRHGPLAYFDALGWVCTRCRADGYTTDVDRMAARLRSAGIVATRAQARHVAIALAEVRAEERDVTADKLAYPDVLRRLAVRARERLRRVRGGQ